MIPGAFTLDKTPLDNRLRDSRLRAEQSRLLDDAALEGTYVKATVSWAQIEPGAFDIRFRVLDTPPFEVSQRTFNVGFKAEAEISRGKALIGIAADETTQGTWFGQGFDQNSVAISQTSLEMQTTGSGSFYQVSIDIQELQRRFPTAPDVGALIESMQSMKLARYPVIAANLRDSFQQALSVGEATPNSAWLRAPGISQSVHSSLVPILAAAVGDSDRAAFETSLTTERRRAAVRTCEEYMRTHIDTTVTLLDLSQACGLQIRSLENAFQAITGMSPIIYLKRLRLSGVRQALQRGDKSQRIISVATDWGFWHMGHFVADYRRMFGETPSQTLLSS
jgi:AraC family transcriptional regulator, ethanolamine operon transcriptional activator